MTRKKRKNGSGLVTARYVHGPGIDEIISKSEIRNPKSEIYFYHYDGLGSVVALTYEEGIEGCQGARQYYECKK